MNVSKKIYISTAAIYYLPPHRWFEDHDFTFSTNFYSKWNWLTLPSVQTNPLFVSLKQCNGSKSWIESNRCQCQKRQKVAKERFQENATIATIQAQMQPIWRYIWEDTVEKSQTNVTSVILHVLGQTTWGHIWKRTVEKSQTNVTSVSSHALTQVLWGHMWKDTLDKSQANVTSVIMHPLM